MTQEKINALIQILNRAPVTLAEAAWLVTFVQELITLIPPTVPEKSVTPEGVTPV